MNACPACSAPVPEGGRFCPACGVRLDIADSPTGTAPRRAGSGAESPSPAGSRRAGTAAARANERFAPGVVLAGRYRIAGLIGRGGMGEVYRADDLKLEQPVALKFLPRALEGDTERLERLYGEVRMARQVSHPAVCRVWDVGEAEGQHFLSMELVDGENLASLLRRIGRFPQDKAVEIARQVADGLAAAHEKGVLHRDLKPANVMLDAQGKVRLTDFGLAGLAAEMRGGDVRSGTPAYMAPEQLQGREVTARSDIYSLGLVLYELVTGRRAFEGKGFAELLRRHRDERPIDPSTIVADLDPAVERTILACLEKDPRRRPASALVVSAMLGGRDPLEAAIAAGETPSPELVAAAGEAAGLRPRAAWACLAFAVTGALVLPLLHARTHLLARVPTEKSPEALEDRARDMVSRLAPEVLAVDREAGFSFDRDFVLWTQERDASPRRWDALAGGDPPLLKLWYRQSPRPLVAASLPGVVDWNDPPALATDMAGAAYDLRGRLLSFYRVPPQRESAERTPAAAVDWSPLFAEAHLDPAAFRPVPPQWTPPFYADARAAWEGTWPRRPEIPVRIEAAAYRGRPVFFRVVNPWTRPERDQAFPFTATQRGMQAFSVLVLVALVAAGAVLAYRNIRLGRGDRRGAFRLALTVAALAVASWALRAHHVADPGAELVLFARGAGIAVLVATLLWLFYLALEPAVRRLRPWTLVSWTRLLDGGGLRDAVVGRDVLIGVVGGVVLALAGLLARASVAWLGRPEPAPEPLAIDALLSARLLLSYVVGLPVNATLIGLALLLLFVLLRLLTRRDLVAAAVVVAFLVSMDVSASKENLALMVPLAALAWGSFVAVMLRFGVLAAITAVLTANLLVAPPLLFAPGHWTGGATVPLLALVVGMAVVSFRSAIGGHSGVRRYLAGDAPSSRPSARA
jgi:serine/threonine-protein kinase